MGRDAAWRTDDVQALGQLTETFFAKEVVPHWERFDAQHHVDRDLWRRAGELGLLCPSIPTEYGGGGGTFAHDAAIQEAQASVGDTGFMIGLHSSIVAHYLNAYGTHEQKLRWLPAMATGELVGAIAMTEPGGGSDLKAMTTRARPVDDGYLISGAKTFISNGQTCDLLVLAASVDPTQGARGVTLFVLELADLAGFSRGHTLKKLGMHAQDTAELFFDDVHVRHDQVLGAPGEGFGMLMKQLAQERLMIGIAAVASAELALSLAVQYAKGRRMFGGSLFDMQHTRFEFAECATLARVARAFIDDCLDQHLDGGLDAATASMVKWWLTDVQCQVVDRCLQVFGGHGYMQEYLIGRLYADARVQKIYGGANEVMKDLIARSL